MQTRKLDLTGRWSYDAGSFVGSFEKSGMARAWKLHGQSHNSRKMSDAQCRENRFREAENQVFIVATH